MADLTIDLNTGKFKAAPEGDFTLGMYANGRGAHKQFSWIASLVAVAAEVFDKVKDSGLHVITKGVGQAAALAAPLCAMPEAVTYGIKSVRAYVDITAECASKTVKKAFGNTVKCAQRTAESMTALMKMNIMDAAGLVAAKFFKDAFACVIDILTIDEAFSTVSKVNKCADERLQKAWQKENDFVFAKGVVGFTFHAMNITGLLCAGVVTFHMVTALASVYTFTVLSAAWYNIERTDIEKEYAVKIANGDMRPLGA